MSPSFKNQIFCENAHIHFAVPLPGVTRPLLSVEEEEVCANWRNSASVYSGNLLVMDE